MKVRLVRGWRAASRRCGSLPVSRLSHSKSRFCEWLGDNELVDEFAQLCPQPASGYRSVLDGCTDNFAFDRLVDGEPEKLVAQAMEWGARCEY